MAHQLYRHFDDAGTLLYVGIALCSVERLAQHRHSSEWFNRVAVVRIEHLPDEDTAREAEAKAIREERPLFNKRGFGHYRKRVTEYPGRAALMRAVKIAGTLDELARRIGKRRQHVWNWLHRASGIPADMALPIERATEGKVGCYELRPDVYPPSEYAPHGGYVAEHRASA